MPLPLRPTLTGIALVASALLLTSCSPGAALPTSSAAPPSASADPTATAAPTEPTAEPTEEPIALALECDAVLTPQQVYDYNPNFGSDPAYEPGGEAAVAVDEDAGTACGWLNQTSGEVIEVAIATPTPTRLETRKNAAAMGSKPVPTYGTPPEVEGYFQQGATGEAQIFTGEYWIVVRSTVLFEPGDAQQLVDSVIANLAA